MLIYFPTPYEDETLYSLLARYHVHVGNQSPKITIKELFGTTTNRAATDLQGNLSSLVNRLPYQCPIDIQDIINFTTLSFYRPFIDEERFSKVKNSMINNNGATVHTRLGVVASGISIKERLYYCTECVIEDKERYGETYWRRTHQAPGVYICTDHKEELKSVEFFKAEINQHLFLQADDVVIEEGSTNSSLSGSPELIGILHAISIDVKYILDNELKPRSLVFYRNKYVSILKEKGLANSNGRVKQKQLETNFKSYYKQRCLKLLGVKLEEDSEVSWLRAIVRKPRKSFHPLYHILMMRFLTGSVENFFKYEKEYNPFGEGNWICLNPAAKHNGEECIDTIEIRYCQDSKKPIGIFKCSCGYIFSRRGPDKTLEDKHKIGKVIEYGHEWEKVLIEMVDKKVPLCIISSRLNVDGETVKKMAEKLNLKTYWSPPRKRENQISTSGDKSSIMRKAWAEVQIENPTLSKTQLREKCPKVYMWLYRNDDDWLQRNSPKLLKPKAAVERVDWQKRDENILLRIKEVYATWGDEEKPVRITKKSISKKINKVALLETYEKKLPKSSYYLRAICESVENFQIRRSKWAIKQLRNECVIVKEWKVYRKAGLRANVTDRVKNYIYTELKNQSFREGFVEEEEL